MSPPCSATIALHDRQAQAGALDGLLGRGRGPEEPGEQLRLLVLRDAHAGVADHDLGVARSGCAAAARPVPPSGVNFTALVSRLTSIRSSCTGSPWCTTGWVGTSTDTSRERSARAARAPRGRWPPRSARRSTTGSIFSTEDSICERVSRSSTSRSSRRPLRSTRSMISCCDERQLPDGAVPEQLGVADDAGDRRTQLVADRRDEVTLDPLELAQPLHGGALVLQGQQQRPLRVLALGHVLGRRQVAGQLAVLAGTAVRVIRIVRSSPSLRRNRQSWLRSPAATEARQMSEKLGSARSREAWRRSSSGRIEHVGQLADDLLGDVAEHRLRARVEQHDAAVPTGRDDRGPGGRLRPAVAASRARRRRGPPPSAAGSPSPTAAAGSGHSRAGTAGARRGPARARSRSAPRAPRSGPIPQLGQRGRR